MLCRPRCSGTTTAGVVDKSLGAKQQEQAQASNKIQKQDQAVSSRLDDNTNNKARQAPMHAESNSNHGCLAGHVASCQLDSVGSLGWDLTNLPQHRVPKLKKKPNKSIRTGS